jgi:hypothetical protein
MAIAMAMAFTGVGIEAQPALADPQTWYPITAPNAGRFRTPAPVDVAAWTWESHEYRILSGAESASSSRPRCRSSGPRGVR